METVSVAVSSLQTSDLFIIKTEIIIIIESNKDGLEGGLQPTLGLV